MHSQGFAFNDEVPKVYLNRKTAQKFAVEKEAYVFVKGERAKLKVRLCIDEAICDNTALFTRDGGIKAVQ